MISKWSELDQHYVWHPFTQVQTEAIPKVIVQAKDAVLIDEEGKEYIDCNSSWWVNIHGHQHPYLKEALIQQFDEVDHIIFAGMTHKKGIELAKRVAHLLPDPLEKVFFSDDGSTSVEVALKMVLQYWYQKGEKKQRIVALEGAYHGDTFGAMSVSQRDYFNKPFEHLFFEVYFIDFPKAEKEDEVILQAENLFKSGEIAAIILEPLVQGSSGMRMYLPSFLNRIGELAKKHNVLVILDEIMTGWGRTGRLFAMNYSSIVPDIVCLSKGLTGGILPLGLTVTHQEIFKEFLSDDKAKALLHGHSYTGNPLACALACASLDLIEDESFFENIERISKAHVGFYNRIRRHEKLADVRQAGTILALEIKQQDANYFSSIRDKAYAFFLDKGLLIRPLGHVIFINPPYCISDEQLQYVYEALEEFLELHD